MAGKRKLPPDPAPRSPAENVARALGTDTSTDSAAHMLFAADGMRAVVTWAIKEDTPNIHQILIEIGGTLPPGRVRSLTPYAAVVIGTNVNEINEVFLNLRVVVNRFAGQVVVVLAAQMAEEALWIYPSATAVIASTGQLG